MRLVRLGALGAGCAGCGVRWVHLGALGEGVLGEVRWVREPERGRSAIAGRSRNRNPAASRNARRANLLPLSCSVLCDMHIEVPILALPRLKTSAGLDSLQNRRI